MRWSKKAVAVNDSAKVFEGVPDEILREHLWVTGGSGVGKSALILAPLVPQVIDRGERSKPAGEFPAPRKTRGMNSSGAN